MIFSCAAVNVTVLALCCCWSQTVEIKQLQFGPPAAKLFRRSVMGRSNLNFMSPMS
jgi:hypothetical protein